MNLQPNRMKLMSNNGIYGLLVELKPGVDLDKLNKLINADKPITLDIDIKREKRSLQANAYAWTLIHDIAKLLSSTDQEIYEQMLHDYGTSEYLVVKAETIAKLKAVYKIVDTVSKVKVNGKDAVQVKCIRGSSTYNTKEMSRLIEGICNECKTLGIETVSPDEIKRMIDMIGG